MFLSLSDFRAAIKDDLLRQVLGIAQQPGATLADSPELAQAVREAVAEMQSYLRTRYDVATLFALQGSARDPILVMYGVDIALYHLHCRIDPRKISDLRTDRYHNAMEWLKAVQAGKLIPDLPTHPDTAAPPTFTSGSMGYTKHRL